MRNEPNFKHYTRGGQISFHNLRMWDQITKTLVWVCLFLWVVLTGIITWLVTTTENLTQALAYYYACFLNLVGKKYTFTLTFHGKLYRQTVDSILHYPYFKANAQHMVDLLGQSSLAAFFLSLILGLLLAFYFVRRGKAQRANQFIRGSRIDTADHLSQQIIEKKENSDITIDGFPLKAHSEVQHLLVHGTVGTGKSQLIMKILDALRKRGDRVIVYDKGCALIPHYFDANHDVILNPFDARCPNWDMWLEAPRDSDFENMAESLIPMHGESDPFWVNAARTVFSSVAAKMRKDSDRSIEKLLKLLLTGEFTQLEDYLKGTAAATLVSGKIEKTAISIRSVITTYLKSLTTLSGLNTSSNPSFSIRDYILEDDNKGWLFISSNGEQHKSLKPLMSMWLAMASLTLLSLTPNPERRIWFICDELPSLHKLPLLGETIAEVRKFGGCFLLGMQSFSQLTKVYGQSGGAKELFDLLNTRFFFRSPSADMARLVASELGEEEIEESRENYSYGANSIRDGISLGSQRVTRPIVSYPQILELNDLNCFVRLPGSYPITQLTLKHQERAKHFKGFVEREFTMEHAIQPVIEEIKNAGDDSGSGVKKQRYKQPMDVEFEV
ncbi:type IV conjugative transfer system coupling protein TraD [Legionella quinlivanii DSM 21216]|uniref:type IV conjugative transfer system coupling protein TraD n=1 Tax=Legionella quinlivanii TaxID=45073 RepID=UPI00089F3409|nr:type IV conjugative transfer system coupling protein TraD [Legionella quinlivanii]SEG42425.1 type IV conjugative transfer system coupling protein TraD [Legionella quinlivanii DSM 21216]